MNFTLPEDINNLSFFKKDNGGGEIFTLNNNTKIIIKKFDENTKKYFYNELNNYFYFKEITKNSPILNDFTVNFLALGEKDNNHMIIMQKLDKVIDTEFLNTLDKRELNSILFQILINIYETNHTFSIYFNDLYWKDKVKNVMVIKNNSPFQLEYKMDDEFSISVDINKYKIVFIDYGYIKTTTELHTPKYMNKYFSRLNKINIISEILLYTFFFYLTLYGESYKLSILDNLNNLIDKIIDSYTFSDSLLSINENKKNFDLLLLKMLYEGIYLPDQTLIISK
jgi:hypothetical protein